MAHPAGTSARLAGKGNAAEITSRENRWLKRFRAALAGERGDDGTVGMEGVRLVEAALGSRLAVEALLVSESGARHLPRVAPVLASDVRPNSYAAANLSPSRPTPFMGSRRTLLICRLSIKFIASRDARKLARFRSLSTPPRRPYRFLAMFRTRSTSSRPNSGPAL